MTWIMAAYRWVRLKLAGVTGRDLPSLYSEVLHRLLPKNLMTVVERIEVYRRAGKADGSSHTTFGRWHPMRTAPQDGTPVLLFTQWQDRVIGR